MDISNAALNQPPRQQTAVSKKRIAVLGLHRWRLLRVSNTSSASN
jgi:hypothetical protein